MSCEPEAMIAASGDADDSGNTKMSLGERTKILLLIFTISLIVLGCAATFVVEPQTGSGTFSGITPEGHSIVVTLKQEGQAFKGEGTINGEPIVLAGPLAWSAVGSLTRSDGSFSSVKVSLSADSEVLTIERLGRPAVVLNRGGTPVQLPSGPFSGSYRAVRGGTVLAEATIVQSGPLVSGVGIITGDPAGINGRVTAPNKVAGVITFLDESQVFFEAELSADERSVSLRGFGPPINLRRK